MTDYYLDTSVAVRIILGHSPRAATWFDDTAADPDCRIISSRLLRTELTRVLRREGLPVANRTQVTDHIYTIAVDNAILGAAESILTHIRTLDAIHLGSALRSGLDDLTIVTHDKNMTSVAEQLGFHVYDPV